MKLFLGSLKWWHNNTSDFLYFRRRIEPWEFEVSFDPRELCKETRLLYEIKWGKSQRIWRHSGKNTTEHVERNFIEQITSERRFHRSVSCCIIWFLSWSPCWECSEAIREFLNQHPRVTLLIYVARLFHHKDRSPNLNYPPPHLSAPPPSHPLPSQRRLAFNNKEIVMRTEQKAIPPRPIRCSVLLPAFSTRNT